MLYHEYDVLFRGIEMLKKATETVQTRPPILEVLPAVLSKQMSPQWCVCQRAGAELGEEQRSAHDRVHFEWHLMRAYWCDAHDYLVADLLRAEQAADNIPPR